MDCSCALVIYSCEANEDAVGKAARLPANGFDTEEPLRKAVKNQPDLNVSAKAC